MRIARITLNGKEYPLCFSLLAVRSCMERYGSMDKVFETLTRTVTVETMDEVVWLMSLMMECGKRYSDMEGLESPEPLADFEIYDVAEMSDFADIQKSIMATISNGGKREVQTEEKKGKKPKKEKGCKS